ncbi:MAG: hypothetical protein ABIY55_15705 [Kofleriaceae bacterium]
MRLDYGDALVGMPRASRAVAEVLVRPCFVELSCLSARRKDRWSKHAKPSVELISAYLADASNDAISLDTKRGGELVAGAELDNGVGRPDAPVLATRLAAYVVVPFVAAQLAEVVAGVCDLAAVLHAAAGFIALEPSYGLAHRVAVGGSRPKERVGLSPQRFRERRGRGHYDDRLATELAGVEWGTFLGAGHLARVDLGELRASGAFARVIEVTPRLAYLQVSEDPTEDLTEGFEAKLAAARHALAPVLMDVSGISLE